MFIFKDDDSRCVYMQQYAKFRDDNRSRDELMDHTEVSAFFLHSLLTRWHVGLALPRAPAVAACNFFGVSFEDNPNTPFTITTTTRTTSQSSRLIHKCNQYHCQTKLYTFLHGILFHLHKIKQMPSIR